MDLIMVCCVLKKGVDYSSVFLVDGDDEEMMVIEVIFLVMVEFIDLGKCLMKYEDVCIVLLIIVFNFLVWKDILFC